MKIFSLPTTITLLALSDHVNAHGFCKKPRATFNKGMYTDYVAITGPSINKAFEGGIYNHAPVDNAKNFAARWEATGYKSLAEMLDPLINGCGNSDENAAPVDVSGMTEMWWANDDLGEGFIPSHNGPCACSMDGKQIFFELDCASKFKGVPAKIPIDFSLCQGKCMFTFHWLALHTAEWQVYKNCIPIINGSGGGNSPASPPNSPGSGPPQGSPPPYGPAPNNPNGQPSPGQPSPSPNSPGGGNPGQGGGGNPGQGGGGNPAPPNGYEGGGKPAPPNGWGGGGNPAPSNGWGGGGNPAPQNGWGGGGNPAPSNGWGGGGNPNNNGNGNPSAPPNTNGNGNPSGPPNSPGGGNPNAPPSYGFGAAAPGGNAPGKVAAEWDQPDQNNNGW